MQYSVCDQQKARRSCNVFFIIVEQIHVWCKLFLFCVELVQVPVAVGLASWESVQAHGNKHAALDARGVTHQVIVELRSTCMWSILSMWHHIGHIRCVSLQDYEQFGSIRIEYGKEQSKVSVAVSRRFNLVKRSSCIHFFLIICNLRRIVSTCIVVYLVQFRYIVIFQ